MYADYTYYVDEYYGDILTAQNADRWLTRASREIDGRTYGRLETAFPTNEYSITRVKDAVCAVAEALCQIDLLQKASAATVNEDGSARLPVTSISSGKESMSFGSSGSSFSAAANDTGTREKLIGGIVTDYLRSAVDANGISLLYAGKEGKNAR